MFHPLSDWSPNDWATALAGEVGELCNLLKKVRRGDRTQAEALDDIRQELADVFIYLDLLSARLGVDLATAVRDKFNAVSVMRGAAQRV